MGLAAAAATELPLHRRLQRPHPSQHPTHPFAAPACTIWTAGTQQAPGKPFIKLDTAAGALVLGFETVADRDDAVELLRQLKPPTAGASGGAAGSGSASGGKGASPGTGGGKLLLPTESQRASLFKADPDLGTLYKSLVVAGILGEAEFWSTRQGLLRGSGGGGGSGSGSGARRQRVGLPSAMLADVKPSADGQTEKVHFQLTPEVIQQASARAWARRGQPGATQPRRARCHRWLATAVAAGACCKGAIFCPRLHAMPPSRCVPSSKMRCVVNSAG